MNKSEINSNAMAATSHPLATEEALKIMKKGGNAVDAALAASIVLSVVEPNATSIGGDCFAIIKMEGKEPIAYNGSGISPAKANYEFFKKNNIDKIGLTSPHSVTVPGAINAWKQIHNDFGKLDFEELFISAINFSENGYKVTKKVAEAWAKNQNKLNKNENTKNLYLKSSLSYKISDTYKNIPLSNSLKLIKVMNCRTFWFCRIWAL